MLKGSEGASEPGKNNHEGTGRDRYIIMDLSPFKWV